MLAANAVFYYGAGPLAWAVLAFGIVFSWAAALIMNRLEDKGRRKLAAACSAVLMFGLLAFFKFGPVVSAMKAGASASEGVSLFDRLVMPLGLSFYTFQAMGYVIDCSRKKQEPEKNPLKYAVFVSFFPQMVQGPISRFSQLAPQLFEGRGPNWRMIKYGVQLAMWGYLKKLLVADRAAVVVSKVFGNYLDYRGAVIVFGVLMYSIQIYCDFSGGIDIARGAGLIFGIDMTENFVRPIFASSLADYWRRWHISLGSWMRDYVFYPLVLSKPFSKLGGWSRKHLTGRAARLGKMLPTLAATFIVYFLIGLWHGGEAKYMVFGLWNGGIIALSQLFEDSFAKGRNRLGLPDPKAKDAKPGFKAALWRIFQSIRTFAIVFIGRYFSRASGVMAALSMLKRSLLQLHFSELSQQWLKLGLNRQDYMIIAGGVAVILLIELYQELSGKQFRSWLERRCSFIQWIFVAAPLLLLLFFGILRAGYISAEFIYKAF